MDGVLVIDKPAGPTSHDVVAVVRKLLGTKRIGHTGTLDPFATGVLVLLTGQATRLLQFLENDEKEYEARIRFGFETDTADSTGKITSNAVGMDKVVKILEETDWESVAGGFRGESWQIPPMYSAKKVAGKKLYELARRGVEIERRPVKINVSYLEIIRNDSSLAPDEAVLRLRCSAGTYVRTLAEDIGRAVGTGAHLTALRRTRAGKFTLQESVTLEDLKSDATPSAYLRPVTDAVAHYPVFILPESRIGPTGNGMPTRIGSGQFGDGEWVRLADINGKLIAMAKFDEKEKMLRPKLVFV